MRRATPFLLSVLVLLAVTAVAQAADKPDVIDPGDTAWMLTASALVLLMTPGLWRAWSPSRRPADT